MGRSDRKSWAIVQNAGFAKELDRLSAKHRGQIARKVFDLASNPKPGGSRTILVGYPGLCRVRVGDFRLIYAFDEQTVQLLTLRRRTERTYEDLDQLELVELEPFRPLKPNGEPRPVADWTKVAASWGAPKPRPAERLPAKIDPSLLHDLGVPAEHHAVITQLETFDQLAECDLISAEAAYDILDWLVPRTAGPPGIATPVVTRRDLVDDRAAAATGPVEAGSKAEAAGPGAIRAPTPAVFATSRRLMPMKPYVGNVNRGVTKGARYVVKLNGTIQLEFDLGDSEYALLTTDAHPALVELVNEAKRAGGSPVGGGGFLINEFRHVLVPTQASVVLFAGVYTPDLEFSFEGTTISPVAPASIRSGDLWPGPHVGVRYTLAAGASDIRYELVSDRGTVKRVALTEYHSAGELEGLLAACRRVKPNGGAIYINEARELFAPVEDGGQYRRRYVGHLRENPWFPVPR